MFKSSLARKSLQPHSSEQLSKQKKGEDISQTTQIYDYRECAQVRHFKKDERFVDLDCSQHRLYVSGDIKLEFFDKDQYTTDKMFHIWFHTGFIENNYLCFEKSVIDRACKDKENKVFDPNFKVEIFLHKVSASEMQQHTGSSGGSSSQGGEKKE